MIYVVLGMHKSGTTLVSELLHGAGIHMVDGAATAGGYDREQFFEAAPAVALNKELLGARDDQFLHLDAPEPPVASPDQRERMRGFIADRQAHFEHWGFKDPRTALVYPLWREELPPHRIVAVYRPPEEIWPRFQRGRRELHRRPRAAFLFLLRWCEHNDRILRTLRDTPSEYRVLSYGELMRGESELARLSELVGAPLPDRRKRELQRGRARPSPLLELARRLLRGRTAYDPDRILASLERLRDHGR